MSDNNIRRLPHSLVSIKPEELDTGNCRQLESLSELQMSLKILRAQNCKSLKSISHSFRNPETILHFINCFKLDQESLIRSSVFKYMILPGGEVPEFFTHRATGSYLMIPLLQSSIYGSSLPFKACVMLTLMQLSPLGSKVLSGNSSARLNYDAVEIKFGWDICEIKECGIQLFSDNPPGDANLHCDQNDGDTEMCRKQILMWNSVGFYQIAKLSMIDVSCLLEVVFDKISLVTSFVAVCGVLLYNNTMYIILSESIHLVHSTYWVILIQLRLQRCY
ncbi:unnamed protein product [Thlaspi arvense]|uniref:C-JID domain-containing protein n=1 Tax=Thlaspi arvense TaxID=13288 RepID=A0AAU9SQE3_THLAR|nr:unnamed protein product [Thlaspi arvense]